MTATVGAERYLNHPTFGMLYRVAPAGEGRDIYATLYAQRMFFLVTLQPRGAQFEVIPYQDARHMLSSTSPAVAGMAPRSRSAGSSCSTRLSSETLIRSAYGRT
jgi:hypothetical protein